MQGNFIFNQAFPTDSTGQMLSGGEDASLYVGNLSPATDEQIIKQHFLPFGQISSVRLMKNLYTGEPRGFAFVNFQKYEDAKKAKEALNHSTLLGREIRICFKKDFKNLDPEANVYIKNLSPNVRGKQMEEEFAAYGPVFSCTVRYDENGKPLGYGYVQFRDKESADKAIQALDGATLFGEKISVERFVPRAKRNIQSWKTNIYVKGFPKSWDEKKVQDFINEKFSTFGEITSLFVKMNEKLGRCFAFVAFKTEDDAQKAIKTMNDMELEGETLYVGFAQKKTTRRRQLAESFARQTNETNLFIKSLRDDVTEEQLKKAFSQYGEVTSVAVQESTKVPKSIESHGVKLKFGFINFKDEADAKKAFIDGKKNSDVRALISEYHDTNKDFLYFAQPKPVREQYLKMVRKNIQSTTALQTQMNLFRMMMNQMQQQQKRGGAPGNSNARGGRNTRGGPQQAAPQGMFPMPMMNPLMMSMFAGGQIPPMDPSGAMGPLPGMDPSVMARGGPMMMMPNMAMPGLNIPAYGGLPTQMAAPLVQPAAVTKADNRDVDWLINNQRQFEQLDPNEKRKLLGNLMYYRVATQPVDKDLVPKITGMLIDLEVLELSDIIEILTKDEALKDRIDDAINIINETDQ